MKIRITEPGWVGYSDFLGAVEFKNGESVDDVTKAEAAFLAGIVRIEQFDGTNPSHSQQIVDASSREAKVVSVHAGTEPVAPAAVVYTQESLSALADSGGIRAIREISDPMGLRDVSIVELIAKILSSQAAASVDAAAK